LRTIEIMSGARVVLVTGANRGIGLEVCRQLASRGHRVILTARDRSKAEASAQAVQAAGDIVPAVMDVADRRSIRTLADDLAGRGEHVDVLVNNAAILVDEGEPILALTLVNTACPGWVRTGMGGPGGAANG
jgi:NAD(P)-dependent dehydrogenase (short-subunit alcohol dehydrogenase family)